ncbi:Mov34/MPN/PAD-1 family protein [Brevibacillus sp. H7]|uniref:Mov34/MPN/PAD-1 family protein n=1 Tax=Brevibacillus sp. H7 TaxID=3349138 RepID=UPI0037F63C59
MFPLGHPFANKNTKLFLAGKVAKRLLTEAQEAFPYEYSALLAGRGADITMHIPLRPIEPATHFYQWDGDSLVRALREISRADLEWLGVLHTHPHSPPVPSQADAAGWHYAQLSYWILSLQGIQPELRVYQWAEGAFQERSYLITGDR